MLKKILDKRIEQFKKDFPSYKVSKKTGSLYAKINVHKKENIIKYSGRAITKGIINKIGQTHRWTQEVASSVYLLTPKGKLMIGGGNGNFKIASLKDIHNNHAELKEVFFIGKKCEWMKDYSALWAYKFFQSFNSLSEAKKFLGYSFISDADFISMFGHDHYDYLTPVIVAKDKKNAVRLLKNITYNSKDLLFDYITMCQDNGFEVEIPAGVNKLEELHDNTVWKINEKNAEHYSKECKWGIKENFTKIWKERGLEFRRLDTPYKMYEQGIRQNHCIGTNYATQLHRDAFYTFTFEGKEYDLQIYNGSVGQFKGRKNRNVPEALRSQVTNGVSLSFVLVDEQPNLQNYPMLTITNSISTGDNWIF